MSTRRRDRVSEKEPARSDGERTGADPEETNQPTPPGGSLHWGPVRELAMRGAGIVCHGPPPAFSPEMDPTEWLDTMEDFFLVNGMPPAHQAASARLLMTEAVRRELFPPGQTRDISWQELRRRLLDAYGRSEPQIQLQVRFGGLRQRKGQPIRDFAREVAEVGRRAGKSEGDLVHRFIFGLTCKELHRELCLRQPTTLTQARQLAEMVTEIEEGRRKTVDDDASGNGGLTKAVEALARRLDKLEATRERPSRLQPTQRATECFECGGLGHIRRDCPQLRTRTRPARALNNGTRDRRLLAMTELPAGHSSSVLSKVNGQEMSLLLDSGAVVSVVSLSTWRKSTGGEPLGAAEGSILLGDGRRVRLCGQGVWSLEMGGWRGRILVVVVESLVVPGILGTNFFDQYVKLIDWQAREMTMTDGSRVRIVREPAQATRPSIGCAHITPSTQEVPLEETVGEGPETDDGKLEACERALVDGAECPGRDRRVLRSIPRRHGKAISCGEADLGRTNLVQHRNETGGALPVKLPTRRLPRAQREVVDCVIRGRAGREQRRQKFLRDRKAHGPAYEPGDQVWMQVPAKTKLGAYWDGPYKVQKKLGGNTYRVKEMKGSKQRLVVHFDRLKPYHGSWQPGGAQGIPREKRKTGRPPWLRDFLHDVRDEHGTCS
ncbi:hypothetical protein T11_492 [Trichinella zimbabwensis]|uniref:CCHC-type domain-containing protein n=1 Tax=Trichinella zimbabwensis TaxID=268475 RepID=A0A0V1GSS8_9BILA|nr:hypothetical protein T11_492 [Trichinella zimbabwensis]